MAIDDLYFVRVQYGFSGINMENTFHLLQTTGTGNATVLSTVVDDAWIPPMIGVQSTSVTHTQIDVTNLDDPLDFFVLSTGDAGGRVGDPMPAFVAWGFKRRSSDRRISSGGIRVGGLSEADIDDGVANAAALGVLATLTSAFQTTLVDLPTSTNWRMVIHTDGNVATGGAPLNSVVVGVPYMRVSTQSSRKDF